MVAGFCASIGILPGEVAVVGDAIHDLAMGRTANAGLAIGVLSGTSSREDLDGLAHIIVESVNDLPGLPEFQR
jgi:phosphoglycolate phosphatase